MEKNCLCISSVALVACGAQGAARRGDQTGGCSCLHVPGQGLRALLQGHALAATQCVVHTEPLFQFHMKSATNMVVLMVDAVGIGRLLLQGMLDFLLLLTSAATAIEPRSNSHTCTAAHALCIVAMQHAH